VEADSRVCLACGATSDSEARFCAQCGRPLDDGEPVPSATSPRRVFGAVSADALFVASCILFVCAGAAFIAGSLVLGVALLATALALFALYVSDARQSGRSSVARVAVRSAHRTRGWARLGGRALEAWTGAGRRVMRLRREARALAQERERRQLELGEAAFQEDDEAVSALRARMHEIDRELAEREREREAAVAAARQRVDDERVGAQRTRQLSLDERGGDRQSSEG
jgi:hypothetical protein